MSRRDEKLQYEQLVCQEQTILEATELVVQLLDRQGVTRQELARRLGKTKGFISHLLGGERNMTLRTLSDLGYALGHRFRMVAEPLAGDSYADARQATRILLSHATFAAPHVEARTPEAGGRSKANFEQMKRAIAERQPQDSHEFALGG